MSEETNILEQTIIEEEGPKYDLAEKLKQKKKLKSKQKKKIIFGIIGLLLFGLMLLWGLVRPKASAEYGICRTLLELQVTYPHTIYVSWLKAQRTGGLKLWYTHTDAFGEYRLETFICKLENNPDTGALEIAEMKVHKVYLDPEQIKDLNHAMIYLTENPIIMNWPSPLPNSLYDLHFDTNSFRKIILKSTRQRW